MTDKSGPSSPALSSEIMDVPSRGSEEELGKLLDDLIVATQWTANWQGDDETCPFVDHEAAIGASLDAKAAIESYVSRLRDERDRLRRIEGELLLGKQQVIEDLDKAEAALASLKEQQLTRYEAETVLMSLERKPFKGPEFDDRCDAGDRASAKLRLLSTSDSER